MNDDPEIGEDPEDEPWRCGLCGFEHPDWMTMQRHWMQHERLALLEWAP